MSHLIHVGNTAGDWEAVYVDGKLIYEGHSIYEFVNLINNFHLETAEWQEIDAEYLEEMGGNFPDNFNDIPKEVFV